MAALGTVTGALNQAQADISQAIGVVNGAAQLAKSLDTLLQEAAKAAAVA